MSAGGTVSTNDWVENFTESKTGGIRDMARYKEAKRVLRRTILFWVTAWAAVLF